MSGTGDDLADLVGELARTTEELRDEIDPSESQLRPPTPGELLRFTTDVTIPAVIFALETNVRALRLVQRALRFGQDGTPERESSKARARAQALGQETLERLDDALAELQDTIAGRPPEDDARQLLDEARELRSEVDRRLEASGAEGDGEGDTESVPIDVESELQSIKDAVDEESPDDDSDE